MAGNAARDHVTNLAGRMAITHRQLVEAAERATDEELMALPRPGMAPIAFHLWHTGRWADRWAEALRGAGLRGAAGTAAPQRWEREDMAARWGFPENLRKGDTGMELPEEEAALLPFPGHGALATYLRGAFNDLEQAIETLDDKSILQEADNLLGETAPLEDSLIRHLSHVGRHLGMIEALRGLRGGHGTATV